MRHRRFHHQKKASQQHFLFEKFIPVIYQSQKNHDFASLIRLAKYGIHPSALALQPTGWIIDSVATTTHAFGR